jgi:hypothetical protein
MKNLEVYENFSEEPEGFAEMLEIPEGYGLAIFGTDEKSLMDQFQSNPYYEETYGSFENWKSTLNQMGEIETEPGRSFLRGKIEWEAMGISYIYEVIPM